MQMAEGPCSLDLSFSSYLMNKIYIRSMGKLRKGVPP